MTYIVTGGGGNGLYALKAGCAPPELRAAAVRYHFTAVEVWEDQKAADAHELTAHAKEYRATLTSMIGALYDQRFYKPL